MNNPKVSVIIPVYNVSKTLRRCIESVRHQTLKNIEIILINDDSPDSRDHEICKEYKALDSRVKYIRHEKNLGLGGARNTGIKAAEAEYIGSVDSDDWVDRTMYEKLHSKAKESASDIVVCGFNKVNLENKVIQKYIFERKEASIFDKLNPTFWNKLWKKRLFIENEVFFPEQVYYQDLATTPRLVYFAERIDYVKERLYYYLFDKSHSSATFKISDKSINDHIIVFNLLIDFIKSNDIYESNKKPLSLTIDKSIKYHVENAQKILNPSHLQPYLKKLLLELIQNLDEDIIFEYKSPKKFVNFYI